MNPQDLSVITEEVDGCKLGVLDVNFLNIRACVFLWERTYILYKQASIG